MVQRSSRRTSRCTRPAGHVGLLRLIEMIGRPLARIGAFLKRERGPVVGFAVGLSLFIIAGLVVALIGLWIQGSQPIPLEYHGVGTSS